MTGDHTGIGGRGTQISPAGSIRMGCLRLPGPHRVHAKFSRPLLSSSPPSSLDIQLLLPYPPASPPSLCASSRQLLLYPPLLPGRAPFCSAPVLPVGGFYLSVPFTRRSLRSPAACAKLFYCAG
ncbi:hypothetical protein HU200_048087 [Digitaria exilis]|uniref:Uncharacterized protein n=1 Tax=Digitaria exilis TaxID=1010633 RepID=A0A835AVS1_9POAL|nr:hypothetical protein HU200_048087 [Digitaria exilis]CAB3498288.1 unnamed protein product [Digitaria exilis]